MLAHVKKRLRISGDAYDDEVQALIFAAMADLSRLGLTVDTTKPLIEQAITLYCKAHFGYLGDEAEIFLRAYDKICVDLVISSNAEE